MQVNVMDKILIDIYNIRNIESVSITDLALNSSDKLLIISSLIVVYDGGKMLNLCAKDKYFDELVKKVVEVYNDEKDNILEDDLINPFQLHTQIEIDEHTKKILESGKLLNKNEIYKFYDKKDSYKESLLFFKDEVNLLLPIIKYHVEEFFTMTDKVVIIDGILKGYRDIYAIDSKIDGIDKVLTLFFNKIDDNVYEVVIGGLTNKNIPLNLQISFKKDGIDVDVSIDSYELNGSFSYQINSGVVKSIKEIKKGNLPICYKNKDLERTENTYLNLADLDSKTRLEWFKLPWGAFYGIENNIVDLTISEKNIEICNMYIDIYNESFIKKEFYSKIYRRNRVGIVDSEEVLLDEVIKGTLGVCLDKKYSLYVVETNFLGNGKLGYYEAELSNRYFCHVLLSDNGLGGITQEKLVSVSKNDNILSKSDILNKSNVLSLVRGE